MTEYIKRPYGYDDEMFLSYMASIRGAEERFAEGVYVCRAKMTKDRVKNSTSFRESDNDRRIGLIKRIDNTISAIKAGFNIGN